MHCVSVSVRCICIVQVRIVELKRIRVFDLDTCFNLVFLIYMLIMYKRKRKCFDLNIQVLIKKYFSQMFVNFNICHGAIKSILLFNVQSMF